MTNYDNSMSLLPLQVSKRSFSVDLGINPLTPGVTEVPNDMMKVLEGFYRQENLFKRQYSRRQANKMFLDRRYSVNVNVIQEKNDAENVLQ